MNFGGKYRDLIAPDKLHVLSVSILVDKLTHSRGGVAANIAYNLSLLHDTSILLASIGSDGQEYLQTLTDRGIDTSYMHMSSLPTSTFTVLTDTEDNQVGGFYPGAMSDSNSLSLSRWEKSDAIVVVSAYDPATMKRIVKEAGTHKLRLVYDIGQQVSNVPETDLREGIDTADVIIVNDYELGVLAKRTGIPETEIRKKVPLIVTTLGSKGSVIDGADYKKQIAVTAVPDCTVVDPTGAGDAFRSGFLYGYRRGWDTVRCVELGSVIASYAIGVPGTQEHTFTLDQVKERYYSTYGRNINLEGEI